MDNLRSLLFTHLVAFYVCNHTNIHWITCIISYSNFLIYNLLYSESVHNIRFALKISPKNYISPILGSHKLISYGFSTLHALFIASCATLYLLNIINNYSIKQAFFISMSYYCADLYYVIDSTNKLTKLDYFTLCHHCVMIYYQMYVFIQTDPILENNLLYYLNRGLFAEYSVPTLNYSWYLVNTKNENSKNMLISSIITLLLYFITRVINFTILLYNLWIDEFLLIGLVMMPLFLINYYWFYKLMCKAVRIYLSY